MRRGWRWAAVALMTALALAYLRDPPWLIGVERGFRPWEVDSAGASFRWIGGRASFFVPADAPVIEIPLRAAAVPRDARPRTVRVSVNDRLVDEVPLPIASLAWTRVRVAIAGLPARGRRVLRVDLHVSHVGGEGFLGVQVGEIRAK